MKNFLRVVLIASAGIAIAFGTACQSGELVDGEIGTITGTGGPPIVKYVTEYRPECPPSNIGLGRKSLKYFPDGSCEAVGVLSMNDIASSTFLMSMLEELKNNRISEISGEELNEFKDQYTLIERLLEGIDEVALCVGWQKGEEVKFAAVAAAKDGVDLVKLVSDSIRSMYSNNNVKRFLEEKLQEGKVMQIDDKMALYLAGSYFAIGSRDRVESIKAGGSGLNERSEIVKRLNMTGAGTIKLAAYAGLDKLPAEFVDKLNSLFYSVPSGAGVVVGLDIKNYCAEGVVLTDGKEAMRNVTIISKEFIENIKFPSIAGLISSLLDRDDGSCNDEVVKSCFDIQDKSQCNNSYMWVEEYKQHRNCGWSDEGNNECKCCIKGKEGDQPCELKKGVVGPSHKMFLAPTGEAGSRTVIAPTVEQPTTRSMTTTTGSTITTIRDSLNDMPSSGTTEDYDVNVNRERVVE